jgi:hypothetical protein
MHFEGVKETLGMSHPVGYPLRARIEVQFIEADIETAFALVDMAESESGRSNFALASEVVANAEEVCRDLDQRLARLPDHAKLPFDALVGEVRRELDLARLHSSRSNQ